MSNDIIDKNKNRSKICDILQQNIFFFFKSVGDGCGRTGVDGTVYCIVKTILKATAALKKKKLFRAKFDVVVLVYFKNGGQT